jgi:FdhD protein
MPKPTVVREPTRVLGSEVDVLKVARGSTANAVDSVAVEEPLEIRLGGWRWTVTMRTPGDDADLVIGLLASEGVIASATDVSAVLFTRHPEEPDLANVADVHLTASLDEVRTRLERHQALMSSSCGLCGKSTVEAILVRRPALPPGPTVDAAILAALPQRLAEAQPAFRSTGGLHAAALFDAAGHLLAAREDIGRHNATDKVLGWRLRAGAAGDDAAVLVVSGRASFEIVQKALVASIPIVAAVSAPSSLAVALARDANMTLAGFVRGDTLNVYAGAERVRTDTALEFIPASVRTALDAVALKISLSDWQALTLDERRRLVDLAAGDRSAFEQALRASVLARTGRPPRPLAPRSSSER